MSANAPAAGTAERVLAVVYRYGLLALLGGLIVFFSLVQPAFPTWGNALVILQAVSITAIIALGVTISLTVGGFDLSVGSTVSFTVMVSTAAQVYWELPWWLAALAGLAAGAGIGLINGLLIVVAKVPDLLATLGTMFAFAGLSLVLTAGQSVSAGVSVNGQVAPGRITEEFLAIGRGKLFEIPHPILIMLLLGVLVTILLARTRSGRLFAAIGGNAEAARLSGVRIGRVKVLAYVLSGTLASVGGVLLAARLGRGDVGVGSPYLLEAVAAALIGFAVLGLNRPNGFGTVIGAIFVGVLLNGLTMLNVPYYLQDAIKGALLVGVLVLSFSTLFRRKERA